jgi:transcriptional regulator with XRE-family HTH domain
VGGKLNPLEKRIGSQIAERRRLANLTQAQLAERIDVATETISRVERGATVPSVASLARIAAALGCEPYELLVSSTAAAANRVALDRLVAALAHRHPEDVTMLADIAARIFQRMTTSGRPNGGRRRSTHR